MEDDGVEWKDGLECEGEGREVSVVNRDNHSYLG